MISFIRYERDGREYLTVDLTFDLAYWFEKGEDTLTVLNQPSSIGRLEEYPHNQKIVHSCLPNHQRIQQTKFALPLLPRGRALLGEELQYLAPENWKDAVQYLYLEGQAFTIPGVNLKERMCNRCGQSDIVDAPCASCRDHCAYCRSCLQMGRSKACMPLFYLSDVRADSLGKSKLKWNGTLTPAQQEASNQAADMVKKSNQELLVWAVCGAGKTEVTFQPVETALQMGQNVLLVTPRKDVVLELVPRFREAFPEAKVIALHGKSTEKWQEAHITLSTTHQAIRFYQKFDFVIIDEVDAYPYHNNPMLYYAVHRARKLDGNTLYLSATPPEVLRKISHVRIPARYHRKPLAIPQIVLDSQLQNRLRRKQEIPIFKQVLDYLQQHQRQAFFFVPFIEHVEELVNQLTKNHQGLTVAGTHSRDPQREEKVLSFRQGQTRVLVTTTIMERGVTVPKTDVLVIGADAPIFDEASLVQISGRAGRSLLDPIGNVVFLAQEKTREMVKAVKHIKEMNKIARKRGMLD